MTLPSGQRLLQIVRNLAIFNRLMILAVGTYAYSHAMPWSEIVTLLFTSLLPIIPCARDGNAVMLRGLTHSWRERKDAEHGPLPLLALAAREISCLLLSKRKHTSTILTLGQHAVLVLAHCFPDDS